MKPARDSVQSFPLHLSDATPEDVARAKGLVALCKDSLNQQAHRATDTMQMIIQIAGATNCTPVDFFDIAENPQFGNLSVDVFLRRPNTPHEDGQTTELANLAGLMVAIITRVYDSIIRREAEEIIRACRPRTRDTDIGHIARLLVEWCGGVTDAFGETRRIISALLANAGQTEFEEITSVDIAQILESNGVDHTTLQLLEVADMRSPEVSTRILNGTIRHEKTVRRELADLQTQTASIALSLRRHAGRLGIALDTDSGEITH